MAQPNVFPRLEQPESVYLRRANLLPEGPATWLPRGIGSRPWRWAPIFRGDSRPMGSLSLTARCRVGGYCSSSMCHFVALPFRVLMRAFPSAYIHRSDGAIRAQGPLDQFRAQQGDVGAHGAD